MNKEFEQWFINQDFCTNMRFIHGDTLFLKDGDVYRVLPVQMTYSAWQAVRNYPEIPDSSSMREQFEQLPIVVEKLKNAQWHEKSQQYLAKNELCREMHLHWSDGAWYAYQEQQKKIETLIQSWNEKGMRGCSDYAMGAMHSLQNCTDELSKVFGDVATVGNTDVSEFQVDWSQAPEWAKWWAFDGFSKKANWYANQPYIDDSSMDEDEWDVEIRIGKVTFTEAPNFNYQGAWQDSLRKRP